MEKWFCNSEKLSSLARIAVFAAGHAIFKNNPSLAKAAVPVAEGILALIGKDGQNDVVNRVLKEAVVDLTERVSDDPVIQMAISEAVSVIGLDLSGKDLPLPNDTIKEIVTVFLNGIQTVK